MEKVVPPSGRINALFDLLLDTKPKTCSSLKLVYIRFVPDGNALTPVSYDAGIVYMTKPMAQHTAISDFVKMAKESNRESAVLLQTNTVANNVFLLS